MDINLNHLRYFVSAAKNGSLAASAKEHLITQSAISQSIRKLEEALGCELLIHNKNRFKLTREGELLLEQAEVLFVKVSQLGDVIRSTKTEIAGKVSIGTSSTIAEFALPSLLKTLLHEHPNLQPAILVEDVATILEKLKTGKVEVGIVFDDGNIKGVEKKLLHEGHFACLSGSQTKNAPTKFLVTKESPGLNELQQSHRKNLGTSAPIAVEVENWEALASMARHGLGVAFLPDLFLKFDEGLKEVPGLREIGAKVKYKIYLIHQGEHQLSRQAKVFYNAMLNFDFDKI